MICLKAAQAPTTKYKKAGKPAPVCNREGATQKGTDMRGKGGKGAPSHIKADPKIIQRAGQLSNTDLSKRSPGQMDWTSYDRATAPEGWAGVLFTIKRGGYAEAAWNDWLTGHGFPTLAEIGPRSGADGWAVPCTLPPRRDGDRFEVNLAEK